MASKGGKKRERVRTMDEWACNEVSRALSPLQTCSLFFSSSFPSPDCWMGLLALVSSVLSPLLRFVLLVLCFSVAIVTLLFPLHAASSPVLWGDSHHTETPDHQKKRDKIHPHRDGDRLTCRTANTLTSSVILAWSSLLFSWASCQSCSNFEVTSSVLIKRVLSKSDPPKPVPRSSCDESLQRKRESKKDWKQRRRKNGLWQRASEDNHWFFGNNFAHDANSAIVKMESKRHTQELRSGEWNRFFKKQKKNQWTNLRDDSSPLLRTSVLVRFWTFCRMDQTTTGWPSNWFEGFEGQNVEEFICAICLGVVCTFLLSHFSLSVAIILWCSFVMFQVRDAVEVRNQPTILQK